MTPQQFWAFSSLLGLLYLLASVALIASVAGQIWEGVLGGVVLLATALGLTWALIVSRRRQVGRPPSTVAQLLSMTLVGAMLVLGVRAGVAPIALLVVVVIMILQAVALIRNWRRGGDATMA